MTYRNASDHSAVIQLPGWEIRLPPWYEVVVREIKISKMVGRCLEYRRLEVVESRD